jgi:hypothetical protein
MNTIERINAALEDWVDSLRGGHQPRGQHTTGLQPKDVLRKILAALEENRVEGLDNKQYVPNLYAIELTLEDPEEKGRLLPFLGKEELAAAIERYCEQHQYILRGPLEITLMEAARPASTDPNAPSPQEPRERVVVHCRFDIPPTETTATEPYPYTSTSARDPLPPRMAKEERIPAPPTAWQPRR